MRNASKNFRIKISRLRAKKGWTQEDLAEASFLSKTSICCYESGKRLPSMLALASIADALGVSIDYLLSNEDI